MGNYPLYHVGLVGCNQIAFFTTRILIAGIDSIEAADVVLLNGDKPLNGTPMVCGTCGLDVYGGDDLEYKDGGYPEKEAI